MTGEPDVGVSAGKAFDQLGAGEGLRFGGVLVLRAPVVEGEQPVADLAFAGVLPVTRARTLRASRSFSSAIEAMATCWPGAVASSASVNHAT